MKNKGFTLIELLAVIIVLAVLALKLPIKLPIIILLIGAFLLSKIDTVNNNIKSNAKLSNKTK